MILKIILSAFSFFLFVGIILDSIELQRNQNAIHKLRQTDIKERIRLIALYIKLNNKILQGFTTKLIGFSISTAILIWQIWK